MNDLTPEKGCALQPETISKSYVENPGLSAAVRMEFQSLFYAEYFKAELSGVSLHAFQFHQ